MSAINQRSFSSGELAPALYARTDVAKYYTGLRTCRNMMVMRHGGVTNRAGTKFIGPVKDMSKTVRLIPFVFNSDQTYVLEFGNLYMRVIHNDAYVLNTANWGINTISSANPGVLTYGGAGDPVNGDVVYITGVDGPSKNYFNGAYFVVSGINTLAKTFNLLNPDGTNANTSTYPAFSSGTGILSTIYKIATSYVEADLQDLRYVQSADVMTIVHPSYAPSEVSRLAHNSWTIAGITFAPSIAAPTTLSNNGGAGSTAFWVATAVDGETGEESLQSVATSGASIPTAGSPITVTIAGVIAAPPFGGITSAPVTYNIYRLLNGIYGYVGSCQKTALATFLDVGVTPDITNTPPNARNPFGSSQNYPSAVTYHQGRIIYGNTNNLPETVFTSKVGLYNNFTISTPLVDNDAVTFTMANRQVNAIQHLMEMGKLLIFTTAGEWAVLGNAAGALTPSDVNPSQYSQNGSSDVPPLVASESALYVQARGNIVRDLAFDFETDGYKGNDLTIFSAHLFDGFTIRDWAFQKIPHSIIWAVRDDGALLGLTYLREQQMVAWHRHDFQGDEVEQVCVIPDGVEDSVYLVIKRTVNSHTQRYIEKITTRAIDDIEDAIFMDATKSYDGTNTVSTRTMTLSGGTTWAYDETITITFLDGLGGGYFLTGDVGNVIELTGSDGEIIRFTLETYTGGATFTGKPNRTVPASLRSIATSSWIKKVSVIGGLWHLEGREVSVFADGFVVANPNNAANKTTVTITKGVATLDKPYGVIHVGLPILADIETLDIDQPQGETLADRKKLITKVTTFVQNTRGLWSGAHPPTDDDTDPLEGLDELKIREDENYDDPVSLATDAVDIQISGDWNSNGRVFLRQVDPLPLTVLSVAPTGLVPYTGGR